MTRISPYSDKDLLLCKDEKAVISDILPGNYEPTPNQWLEIAAEITRAVGRFRHLKAMSISGNVVIEIQCDFRLPLSCCNG